MSEIAELIRDEGWSQWELKAGGAGATGFASAAYAVLAPAPWTLLPLNAALHALGTLFLFLTFLRITSSNWYSLFGALPFLLFPSSVAWTSQIMNDSYATTGAALYLYGWVSLFAEVTFTGWRHLVGALVAMLAGIALVWLVRPFLLELYMIVSAFFLMALIGARLWNSRQSRTNWQRSFVGVLMVAGAIALLVPVANSSGRRIDAELSPSQDRSEASKPEAPNENVRSSDSTNESGMSSQSASADTADPDMVIPDTHVESESELSPSESVSLALEEWEDVKLLPTAIDSRIRLLSRERRLNVIRWQHASSNIDTEVQLRSTLEVIQYIPRAVQIGLLAPFPEMWFGLGTDTSSSVTRLIGGVEMVLAYLALFALPYALWRWRRSVGMWITLAFCLGILLVYAVATPNVGSLMRFRYAYFVPIVGLGVIGWADIAWRAFLSKRIPDAPFQAA